MDKLDMASEAEEGRRNIDVLNQFLGIIDDNYDELSITTSRNNDISSTPSALKAIASPRLSYTPGRSRLDQESKKILQVSTSTLQNHFSNSFLFLMIA